jgi:hypothetical protein
MRANWTWPGEDKVFELAPGQRLGENTSRDIFGISQHWQGYWLTGVRFDEEICWSASYRNAPAGNLTSRWGSQTTSGLNMDGTGTCDHCCFTYSSMNIPGPYGMPVKGPGISLEPAADNSPAAR